MQKKFTVEGMSCSACSASVERVVSRIDGVDSASVDLISKTLICLYDSEKVSEEKIINAVSMAGFSATVKNEIKVAREEKEELTPVRTRLIVSTLFLIILMYISMGHMISLPLPNIFDNAVIFATFQLILTFPVVYVNRKFFFMGFRALKNGSPNMDTLVAVGSLAGVIYGIFAIFMIVFGDTETVHLYRHNLYFESSAMILTLVTLGKFFESRSKDRTGEALRGLESLSPERSYVLIDGKEVEILTADIKAGDTVVLRPGSRVPVDGIITEGSASFDVSALTGESMPVDKEEGDEAVCASLVLDGRVLIKATRVGEETTLSRIIDLVETAGASKARVSRLADKISRIFVPSVMAISALTLIIWLILGKSFDFSLSRALSVLVISCPCALGLATPVAITVSVGRLAGEGILVKSGNWAEDLTNVKTAIFDKTGTVTTGEMSVSDILFDGDKDEIYGIVKGLEEKSEHPLAKAITEYMKEVTPREIGDFKAVSGRGVEGVYQEKKVYCGNISFMKEKGVELGSFENISESLSKEGKTAMLFAIENRAVGVIAIKDTVKPDARETVSALKKLGIKTVLLTGDNRYTAEAVAKEVGFDEWVSEVMPEDKEKTVREYKKNGAVLMVGDGINDSPALAAADASIAIGTGTDIAIDASSIILMSKELKGVVRVVTYAGETFKNIKENLFWAFFYNTLGIPLAAGVFYFAGILLSPMIGAAAMSFSSVFVVTNALRLYRK